MGFLSPQHELLQGCMACPCYNVPPVQIRTKLISKFNCWQKLHQLKLLNLLLATETLSLRHLACARFCNVSKSANKPSVTGAESYRPAPPRVAGERASSMQSQVWFFQWKFPITHCVAAISYLLLEQLPFLWDQLQTVSLELLTSHV